MNKENKSNITYSPVIFDKLRKVVSNNISNCNDNNEQHILSSRAVRLAEKESVTTLTDQLEILEFTLSGETYAIETSFVKEVSVLKELTTLPYLPGFIKGIINHRGRILSVIDIKEFFNLPNQGITNLNKVIILENKQMDFGILADEIIGVKAVSLQNIQSKLPNLNEIRQKYLQGILKDRLILLDGEKLLNDSELIINDEI